MTFEQQTKLILECHAPTVSLFVGVVGFVGFAPAGLRS